MRPDCGALDAPKFARSPEVIDLQITHGSPSLVSSPEMTVAPRPRRRCAPHLISPAVRLDGLRRLSTVAGNARNQHGYCLLDGLDGLDGCFFSYKRGVLCGASVTDTPDRLLSQNKNRRKPSNRPNRPMVSVFNDVLGLANRRKLSKPSSAPAGLMRAVHIGAFGRLLTVVTVGSEKGMGDN